MAGLLIEGDLVGIHEAQLQYLKEQIEKLGHKDAKVVVETVGKAGDNYTSAVKKITIEDKNGASLKIIAKFASDIEQFRKIANLEKLYSNEHVMYTKVFPKYEQLQTIAGISAEDKLKYARFYGSNKKAPYEVVLLEDLNEKGYEMLDRFTGISNECVKSVLKNLAVFHALSYALKYKEPDVFEEIRNELFDSWGTMSADEDLRKMFVHMENNILPMIESDAHIKAVKGIMIESLNASVRFAKINQDSKHSVIQQGDAWTNNIMFIMNDPSNPESIMIDYQMSRVSNPCSDLHYMLFTCTDYETRKAHYLEWIDFYHDELDKSLSYFGLKTNFIYSRDQLDADLRAYGKWSLGQSIMMASMMMRKNEEAAQLKEAMKSADTEAMMKEGSAENFDMETIVKLKTKMEGVISSHLELGYL